MSRHLNVLAVSLLSAFIGQAFAQEKVGDAAVGRAVAAARCNECHALEGRVRGRQQADPFVEIARLPSTTSLALHAFLLTPHPSMPNLRLTPQEVDDVVAYILSLRSY